MPNYREEVDTSSDLMPTPFDVLTQAARQMEQQTGGLVHGEIYVAPFLGTIRYTFYLVIPLLNDYTDPLFYVWTSQPNRGYPVYLLESGTDQREQTQCDDDRKLVKRLGEVFSSTWAKSRIRQWIEMAEEREPAHHSV